MADRKITDLTALTTPASADVLPIVDVSEVAAADKNKKITVGELFKGVPDGSAAAPAIAFETDDGNGLFLSTTDTIGIATNGVSRATVSTTAVTSTLPVIVPDGSAAAPSVAFTGSGTDTGLYSPGADQVAISTNGTGRLFVDADGNVGIGGTTTTGWAQKQVVLDSGSGASASYVLVNDTTGRTATDGGLLTLSGSDLFLINRESANLIFRTANTERLRIDSSGRLGLGTSSPTDVKLDIKQSGTDVVGTGHIGFSSSSTPLWVWRLGAANADLSLDRYSGGWSSTPSLTIQRSTGNVGIGTTSPVSALNVSVADSGNVTISSTNDGHTGGLAFGDTSSNTSGRVSYDHGNNSMRFDTAGNERCRLTSDGKFLVGTSSARGNFYNLTGETPQVQLEGLGYNASTISLVNNSAAVSGSRIIFGKSEGTAIGSNTAVTNGSELGTVIFAGNDGTNFVDAARITCNVDGTPGADDMPGRLVFSTTADGASSPTERMRISQNGQTKITGTFNTTADNGTLAINTDSNGNFFYPRGYSVGTTSGVALYIQSDGRPGPNSSSERYKTSINDLSDIQWLKDLRPVSFFYKDEDGQATGDQKFGLIAEEVDKVNPDLVFRPNGVIESVHYDQLIAPLLAAYQQAVQRIEQLEAKVTALEAR